MRKLLLLHLFLLVISVSFFLASSYFHFAGEDRWYSGAFPEALRFNLLISLPLPFVVVSSILFLSFLKIKSKIPKVLAILITLTVAFIWLGIMTVGHFGWGPSPKGLTSFAAWGGLVSGLVSVLFGLWAIYKKH